MRDVVKWILAIAIGGPIWIFLQGAILIASPVAVPLWYLLAIGSWSQGGKFEPMDPIKCLFFPCMMWKDVFLGID